MPTPSLQDRLVAVQNRSTVRLTTLGRKTGNRHTVTVWFLVDGDTVYLATLHPQRGWPRNVIKNGHVELDVGGQHFTGRAVQITNAKQLDRVSALLQRKYWLAWIGSWFGKGAEGAFEVAITG